MFFFSKVNSIQFGLFDMETFKLNPNHLDESEVNYELAVRNCTILGSVENRRRDLRVVFRDPDSERYVRVTEAMMNDDLREVPKKLKEIADLLNEGPHPTCFSRLVHYYLRIRRYTPRTAQQQEDLRCLLEMISKISAKYFATGLDESGGYEPIAESTTRGNPSGGDTTVVQMNQTMDQPSMRSSMALNQTTTTHVPRNPGSPWLMSWDETEGAEGGTTEQSGRDMSKVIPALVEDLLNFRHAEQSTGTVPRQVEFFNDLQSSPWSLRVPSLRPGEVSRAGVSTGTQEMSAEASGHPRNRNQPEIRMSSPPFEGVSEDPRVSGHQPSESARYPDTARVGGPNNEYIHVSEIDKYIKRYIDQLIGQGVLPYQGRNQPVDNLTEQMANTSIRPGINMSHSRYPNRSEVNRSGTPVQRTLPDPSPPLQLSGYPSGTRQTLGPESFPGIERNAAYGEPPMHRSRCSTPRNEQTANVGYSPGIQRSSVPLPSSGLSRRLPHQQCSIIEKWPKFTGDSNAVPVTDFLRQINILSRSYDISKDELRMHAHLLFKDSAYVWFTTYEEKFTSWEVLEAYLKMRYDNPNRDRIIKEEMRARKQRPTELFSAYLTDMEMLAQRMIKKMSEAEKFEIIVENMKLSYKRRLALEPIHSIEHLAQLCFKFDALESNLYSCSVQPRPTVHQVECEEDGVGEQYTDEDLDEIYALKARIGNNISKTKPRFESTSDRTKQSICWNCQRVGHMWKDCDKRKTIFCHICGLTDTTAYRCPNKHELGQKEELPKNE